MTSLFVKAFKNPWKSAKQQVKKKKGTHHSIFVKLKLNLLREKLHETLRDLAV